MRNLLYWDFRNLEDSEASLEEVVKSGAGSLRTKFATEELEKRFTRMKRGRDGTCMPRRAKMKMKRTRRTSRATMEAMESTRDLTKPPMAFQYL